MSLHQNLRFTYSEVSRRVDEFAAGLRAIGLQYGDRIGIWGQNDVEWLIAFLGASRAGLIVAGINPAYVYDEFTYCLNKIEAKAVVAPEYYRDFKYAEMSLEAKKVCKDLEHIIIWSENHVR